MENLTDHTPAKATLVPNQNPRIYVYSEVLSWEIINNEDKFTEIKSKEIDGPGDLTLFYLEGEIENKKELNSSTL